MHEVDPDPDDDFDEPTDVGKGSGSQAPPPDADPLDYRAATVGHAAETDEQIFESMPSVNESIERSPKKPKDDWASSSEFDAFGESDRSEPVDFALEDVEDDDQDFDTPTNVHTRTPTPPPDEPDTRLPPAGFQVHAAESGPQRARPLSFDESVDSAEGLEAGYDAAGGPDEFVRDEFAVEVEVASDATEPESSPEDDDEAWGAILQQAWAPCEPHRDLPTKHQRVAFADAAIAIHTVLLPHREMELSKGHMLAQLQAQIAAQASMVSYTPPWRECDKEIGKLLPQLEKLIEDTAQKIPAGRYRGPYLCQSFDRETCLNYFEHEVRSGDQRSAWWERISSLAVASASTLLPNGERELLPVTEVVQLWSGRLPEQKAQNSTIVAAARFFQESIVKLAAMKKGSEYFESGLALEVIGYQISLREDVFRPEVLYASTDFHTKLNNWLNNAANRPLNKTFDRNFTTVFETAASIFGL